MSDAGAPGEAGPSRVLVTGAAGFIGGAIVRDQLARGRRVLGIDRAAGGQADGEERETIDVTDRGAVLDAFARWRPDAVVHAAAQLPSAPGDDVRRSNVDGTRNVLDGAARSGAGRAVFLSTTTLYALDGPAWRDERSRIDPTSPYGRSKREAESLCTHARRNGLPVAVLRLPPVVGPGRSGLFHHLFEWVREGRRIPLVGDGRNRVQLLHVDDCAAAVDTLLTAPPAAASDVFNVGATEVDTVYEEVRALCIAAGTRARPVRTLAWPVERALFALHGLGATPTHPWMVAAASREMTFSTAKLQGLGWSPKHSGAGALVDAYRAHLAAPPDVVAPAQGHRAPWRSRALDLLRRLG